jgi:hypothetical protein
MEVMTPSEGTSPQQYGDLRFESMREGRVQ